MNYKRPRTKEELQKREAIGVIRASRFVRKFAHSRKEIGIKTILSIHKEIFNDAWPEIAGKYRDENIKITYSKHLPPHYSEIETLMNKMDYELQIKLRDLKSIEGIFGDEDLDMDILTVAIDKIIHVAAWLHHAITFIHPFREGNGRTARLAANLILERYGLVGISIKIEQEDKDRYRKALSQIDIIQDYEPLANLISEGLIERYDGVAVKYYEFKKKK